MQIPTKGRMQDKEKKVQVPKRNRKIQFGDHIPRSEYTEGVRRNNNRCSNRLSKEMQYYEKAQKVILKNLGKETQQLHARMSSTLATPRLEEMESPSLRMTNPFAVYGSPVIPFLKMDHPRRQQLKPIHFSKPRDPFHTPRTSLTSNSMKMSFPNNDDIIDRRSKASSQSPTRRLELSSPVKVTSPYKILLSDTTSESFGRLMLRSDTDMSFTDFGSTAHKDGRRSIAESMRATSRLNSGRSSHVSFIDILKEAEERKAKETISVINEDDTKPLSSSRMRPKTPNPMSNYDDPKSGKKTEELIPKSTHLTATPKATFINVPS
ncbi:uncharacterized protein LOC134247614 [Saccostrea cucullata]|uniref:uncharacterized protein LOC134247614 n=1 Tax=Saccostrea cuccullata TaxID=36930 RepID=UPI002ED54D07